MLKGRYNTHETKHSFDYQKMNKTEKAKDLLLEKENCTTCRYFCEDRECTRVRGYGLYGAVKTKRGDPCIFWILRRTTLSTTR